MLVRVTPSSTEGPVLRGPVSIDRSIADTDNETGVPAHMRCQHGLLFNYSTLRTCVSPTFSPRNKGMFHPPLPRGSQSHGRSWHPSPALRTTIGRPHPVSPPSLAGAEAAGLEPGNSTGEGKSLVRAREHTTAWEPHCVASVAQEQPAVPDWSCGTCIWIWIWCITHRCRAVAKCTRVRESVPACEKPARPPRCSLKPPPTQQLSPHRSDGALSDPVSPSALQV